MKESSDGIVLRGIECRVRLGVPESERRRPQRVLIDVAMRVDLRRAGVSDRVRDTVDYWAVERAVRRAAETGVFRLAERLAEAAARAALRSDARIDSVRVAVHKKPKVMPRTAEVVVEISRGRRRASGSPF